MVGDHPFHERKAIGDESFDVAGEDRMIVDGVLPIDAAQQIGVPTVDRPAIACQDLADRLLVDQRLKSLGRRLVQDLTPWLRNGSLDRRARRLPIITNHC